MHRTDLQAIIAGCLLHGKRGAPAQDIGEMARPGRIEVLDHNNGGVQGGRKRVKEPGQGAEPAGRRGDTDHRFGEGATLGLKIDGAGHLRQREWSAKTRVSPNARVQNMK